MGNQSFTAFILQSLPQKTVPKPSNPSIHREQGAVLGLFFRHSPFSSTGHTLFKVTNIPFVTVFLLWERPFRII